MVDIVITVGGSDPSLVDEDARQLHAELEPLPAQDVRFAPAEPAPGGAKGLDAASVTTIIVALASSPVLRQLGLVLRDWVNRDQHRKLVARRGEDEVEIVGRLDAEQEKLVEEFFRRQVE
ncbi:hypothetical protein [Actinokineospora bangkokensis]|nr:hypothetical protein [Actinokineospora bangkokensis]